jgi:hypothetical protein
MDFEEQKTVLNKLVETIDRLQFLASLNPIEKTLDGKFRHSKKTDHVYLYMKALRYVSLMNSALILTENGFFQEVGILCRCLNETQDDFCFVAMPNSAASTDRREQHLEEFYLEEFKPKTTGLLESNKRNRVKRKTIHSTIAASITSVNQSDVVQVISTLETAYSGYVHGAYGHLMELYGGPNFGFRANGLPPQAFAEARERDMSHHIYRGVLILERLAQILGEEKEYQSLLVYRKALEEKYPEFASDPNVALRQAKKPK